jgi:hypothetical protein
MPDSPQDVAVHLITVEAVGGCISERFEFPVGFYREFLKVPNVLKIRMFLGLRRLYVWKKTVFSARIFLHIRIVGTILPKYVRP